MRQGLPFSLLIHLVVLAGVLLYGQWVAAPPLDQPRLIRVSVLEVARKAQPSPPAPEPTPSEPEPEPAPAPPPEPEPAKVPEKPPEKPARKPEPERPAPQPQAKPAEEPPAEAARRSAGAAGPDVTATDEPFPFDWYLEIVRQQILRNWNPPQMGMQARTTAVHFVIERDGTVRRPTLLSGSGSGLLDREALRAVQATHRLPPLPREFPSRSLGVTFEFTIRSGP